MNLIPSSTKESETARDGVLSTLDEYHALIPGVVVGAVVAMVGTWELGALFVATALGAKLGSLKTPALKTIRREPWYALGGFGIGAVAVRYGADVVDVLLVPL